MARVARMTFNIALCFVLLLATQHAASSVLLTLGMVLWKS